MINANIGSSFQGLKFASTYANTLRGRRGLAINIKNKQEKERLARKKKIKAARAARKFVR